MEFLQEELDEILNIFSQESSEILQSMDKNLLLLEKKPDNLDVAMHLFRDAHSLKGSARMLGFEGIQNIAHKIEDVLGLIREEKLKVNSYVTDAISSALSCIDSLIKKTVEQKSEFQSEESETHIRKLASICLGIKTPQKKAVPKKIENEIIENQKETKQALKNTPINSDILELMGKISETIPGINKNKHSLTEARSLLNETVSHLNNSAEFKKIFQTILSIISDFEKNQNKIENDEIDAVKEILSGSISIIKKTDVNNPSTDYMEEIELLNQKAAIVSQMIKYELLHPDKGEKPVKEASKIDWAQGFESTSIKTLRVNSNKLDKLVNQIGDLIVTRIKSHENAGMVKAIQDELIEWQKHYHKIGYYMKLYEKKYIQEALSQTGGKFNSKKDSFLGYNRQIIAFHNSNDEKMSQILSNLNILMKELNENNVRLNSATTEVENMVKSMRVLPLSTVFNLFPRMVHNISKDKGKEIELVIEGGEVSADKKIIEDIKIPIMHVVRNSIDHGIETPKERERAGKNKTGNILIKASQKENKIVVSIKDDGRGINIEKIKQKAIEKGLITKETAEDMTKEQLANFIFYPGFSTGEKITELSGRGLGLDIVHTKISQLNGRIDVYSEENKGTIVTMELPTTMATMKAFIIKENGQLYAISAGSIEKVLRISVNDIKKRDGRYYYLSNNEAIPVCTLSSILNTKNINEVFDKYTMMVIKSESVTTGLIVQRLVGSEEILNKKLPEPMLRVKNISGITTLANGEMCLLLNISDILKPARIAPVELLTPKALLLEDNSKYKIFVVDDSITTRRLLSNILSSAGYTVETEASPKNALKLVDLNKYDLIISDYEMPEMNGLEFVKQIKSREKNSKIPVFAITSSDKQGLGQEFFNAGAQEFIQKTAFKQKEFLELVNNYLLAKRN